MKPSKIVFTLIMMILTSSIVNAQYTKDDFSIETKGLSEEYASRFKDSIKVEQLVSIFNQLRIIKVIAPIKITASYDNGEGYVIAELNYDHDKVFSPRSDYTMHDKQWKGYGKGISVLFQEQIFLALSQYKKSVATKGWSMDKDLLSFKSAIILKKSNGDSVLFYAYNYLDSRGFYPCTFYRNVHIQIGDKTYETETGNTKMLNDMKYFFVGKIKGLDGKKTGAYYFCKFFNIKTE